MINITDSSTPNISALDGIARAVLGADTTGVSVQTGSAIHLVGGASASKQSQAQKIFDNWGNLGPVPSVTLMVVGAVDPTIVQTSTDEDVAYVVTLDGANYASGTVSVIAGTATLTLVDPEAGEYVIYFARTQGNFASGSTTITVTES